MVSIHDCEGPTLLANALLADIETEEEQTLAVATAESPTGFGSEAEQLVATSTAPHTVVAR
jgi:hypothetical protein